MELLERIFGWNNRVSSRDEARRRLKLIIAHDRASISPDMIELMRKEILEVVARYLEIDQNEMEFALESNNRITALIANLPIRNIKRLAIDDDEVDTPQAESSIGKRISDDTLISQREEKTN
jgi:cell division topological specificity factor